MSERLKAMLDEADRSGFAMAISAGRVDRRALVDEMLSRVGRGAELTIVTWTIGLADCLWLEEQVTSGRVGTLRVVADVNTRSKTPERYEPLARFGQVIDVGDVHAKASIVKSADGAHVYVEVTSANLNQNRRAESWAISTSHAVADVVLRDLDAVKRLGRFDPSEACESSESDDWSELAGLFDA